MAQKQNPTPMELKSSPPTVFRELPGPRPAPLGVSKESHKIRKSPSRRARVTFYQTSRSDFMSMVQSLSGYSGDGDLVPMARLASIVKTKTNPSKIDRDSANSINTTTAMLKEESVGVVVEILRQTSTHPGSPEPLTLPPIPDGFF